MNNIITFNPPERFRTYYFSNGEKVVLKDVEKMIIRSSGTHRLRTLDGKHHIIPTGWLHIELDIDDWTF